MRDTKGVTLIEMIVIVCILAIVAAVGVTSYVRYIDRAHDKACLINRTELVRGYVDFCDLFGTSETLADYVSAEAGGVDHLCPGGGVCVCGTKNGEPYIFCSKHDAHGG